MKYILIPIWSVLVFIYTFVDVLVFVLFAVIVFLYTFKKSKVLTWQEWTKSIIYINDDFDAVYGYDNNPFETIVRRITAGEYKNKK